MTMPQSLYEALADEFQAAIGAGRLTAGVRLPSIRETARSRDLSINTVLAAYHLLEARGQVEARPQSGYFVRAQLPAPLPLQAESATLADSMILDRISAVVAAQSNPETIDLSLACPMNGDAYPGKALGRLIAEFARRRPELLTDYSLPPGPLRLRREICRNAHELGMALDPDEIVLTNGCMEALQLALRAVTQPGDTVAIESPTYFNLVSLIDHLGLSAIEVPTDPDQGMSLAALELLLSEKRIQAVVTMPNVHNPLGTGMPDTAKQRLAGLAKTYRVPVIEDVLYAELQYAAPVHPAVKAFDTDGWVIVCASYTKTLAPGFRLGWMNAGRFRQRVAALKFSASIAQPAFFGEVLGDYLESGGYAQHLRRPGQSPVRNDQRPFFVRHARRPADRRLSRVGRTARGLRRQPPVRRSARARDHHHAGQPLLSFRPACPAHPAVGLSQLFRAPHSRLADARTTGQPATRSSMAIRPGVSARAVHHHGRGRSAMSLSTMFSASVDTSTSHSERTNETASAKRLRPKSTFPAICNSMNKTNIERAHKMKLITPKPCISLMSPIRRLSPANWRCASSVTWPEEPGCSWRITCANVRKRLVYASNRSEIAGKSSAGVVSVMFSIVPEYYAAALKVSRKPAAPVAR